MSLHRLDESATVECNLCNGKGSYQAYSFPGHGQASERLDCTRCNQTGRVPGEPDVEVLERPMGGFYYKSKVSENVWKIADWHPGHPTQAAALQAAREASKR